MQYQFCSALHREGNRTFIPIPFNVWEETGLKGNIPCRVCIQNQCFECKLIPKGNGTYWIPIAKRMLTVLGTQEEYEIILELIENLKLRICSWFLSIFPPFRCAYYTDSPHDPAVQNPKKRCNPVGSAVRCDP